MKISPPKDFFNEIQEKDITYIDGCISDKTPESYYLDFKLTEESDYTNKRNLFNSDKKNYAKCISAFGNSEGGIVVWGVETGKADEDFAVAKKPITNVSNFLSLLESSSSVLVSPPHPNIENIIIWENKSDDIGYVVTLIPKSHKRLSK